MNKAKVQPWLIAGMCVLALGGVSARPAITIYNQNFAVVRDQVPLNLEQGLNQVSVTEITAQLDPNSVILRDPAGKQTLRILEQNYRSDPISQELLLSLNEGKEIGFLTSSNTIVKGKIIRSAYVPHPAGQQRYGSAYAARQYGYSRGSAGQPIIEIEGQLRFSLPGIPLFPSLGDGSALKPTLNWVLESEKKGKLDAELCYLTGGMSWQADYNMIAPEQGDTVDVIGWVTMDNQSGRTFRDAVVKLMAGDVSKIQDQEGRDYAYASGAISAARDGRPPAVKEKAFDDYHLYTLGRNLTLLDRETKQVEFVRSDGIKAERVYIYNGASIDPQRYRGYSMESIRQDRDYGTKCNRDVWVMREFKNTKENHLGIPLPRGKVRFYRRDTDGQLEFTGENLIDHTPNNETVRVYTGNAFDLVGERRRTEYKVDNSGNRWLDESFEIKVRNRKEKEAVEIRVVENLYRWVNWEIMENTSTYLKTDSQTIEFRVQAGPGEEKTITYRVHYTW